MKSLNQEKNLDKIGEITELDKIGETSELKSIENDGYINGHCTVVFE